MGEGVDPTLIMTKWRDRTAAREGCFVRHLDGKLQNEDPSNLENVHPFDVFRCAEAASPACDWPF